MPPIVPAVSRSNVQLSGKVLNREEALVVQTPSHEIALNQKIGDKWFPDFKASLRRIEDPQRRSALLTPRDFASVRNAETFKAQLQSKMQTTKDYVLQSRELFWESLPQGADKSLYAYNSVIGRRVTQFFNEAKAVLRGLRLASDQAAEAARFINKACEETFEGKRVHFDPSSTETYWSFSQDASFVHFFETLLSSLPENHPLRAVLQNQIDYVLTNKHTPHGEVDENNVERSLELVAIDAKSRHVVSMTKDSERENTVRYEVLYVEEGPDKRRYVVRDANRYFYEDTGQTLPRNMQASVKGEEISKVVFRRALHSSEIRNNFRFDWNKNRMVEVETINTSWWGHCDIRAILETLLADMHESGGVSEYRSDSRQTVILGRDKLLEALASLVQMGGNYSAVGSAGIIYDGDSEFAASRYDEEPSQLLFHAQDGSEISFPVRFSAVGQKNSTQQEADIEAIFLSKLTDEAKESFWENPDFVETVKGDYHYIDASSRWVEGTTESYSFNAAGQPFVEKRQFKIDFSKTQGEPVFIGNFNLDSASRSVTSYYYDPATRSILSAQVSYQKNGNNFFAQEGARQTLYRVSELSLGMEAKRDDQTSEKLKAIQRAIQTGEKIAADSESGVEVWNGEVQSLLMVSEFKSQDGRWERVRIEMDARFGEGKIGRILNKLDENGEIIESLEIDPVVDFFWKEHPRVAPLLMDAGRWYVNTAMVQRGLVQVDRLDNLFSSAQALQDIYDFVYLGLKARKEEEVYSILHEEKRYLYDTRAAWQEDIKKLEGERVTDTQTPPGVDDDRPRRRRRPHRH